jgi:hypothetical protein
MYLEKELQYQPLVCHQMFGTGVQNIEKINGIFNVWFNTCNSGKPNCILKNYD